MACSGHCLVGLAICRSYTSRAYQDRLLRCSDRAIGRIDASPGELLGFDTLDGKSTSFDLRKFCEIFVQYTCSFASSLDPSRPSRRSGERLSVEVYLLSMEKVVAASSIAGRIAGEVVGVERIPVRPVGFGNEAPCGCISISEDQHFTAFRPECFAA